MDTDTDTILTQPDDEPFDGTDPRICQTCHGDCWMRDCAACHGTGLSDLPAAQAAPDMPSPDASIVQPSPDAGRQADDVTTRIEYCKETRDYAAYATVGGKEELIRYAGSYSAAVGVCRDYRFNFYLDRHTPERAAEIALEEEPAAVYADPRPIKTFGVSPVVDTIQLIIRTGDTLTTETFLRKHKADRRITKLLNDGYKFDATHETLIDAPPAAIYACVAAPMAEFIPGDAPPALTCEQCVTAKPESAFTAALAAPLSTPAICDACLDTLPMELVQAMRRQNAAEGRAARIAMTGPLLAPASTAAPLTTPVTTTGHDALVDAAPTAASPPFTRTERHDLRTPADRFTRDAWTGAACGHVFWVEAGHMPLSCPRCVTLAAISPINCPACGGAHLLARCEELAAEWRDQAQAEIRAGAQVGAHITRDIAGFLREYAALTAEQQTGVVASYCAWQRAECRPAVVARRWARMAGLAE